jgi:uncharacterized delta-60 repeat protein
LSAGDLDTTFGVGGKMLSQAVGFAVRDIAVQADGRVIAVGELGGDFGVARVGTNGRLDPSFGRDGIVRTSFGGNRGDYANAVAIQPDGKIVAAGRRGNYSSVDL